MIYRALTELVVAFHFLFIVFVMAGAALVWRWRWIALPHVIAVVWAFYVEAAPGIICPLTPLENHFAALAGAAGYSGSFVEHYLVPIIYPDGLTPHRQWALAALVVVVNVGMYGMLATARRRRG